MGRGFEPLRGHSTKMLNVWHKTVCLTFSIFLFVFFGEMGGASGREVLYNNSKIILFRFFIPKKYTNFATACVWEEAKAAGQRLHCRGPDEEEFFRLFPLHTLDYKRFTNK